MGQVTRARGKRQGRSGDMWQGHGACSRVWRHVAGGGGMWQGVGSCGKGWACHKGYEHMAGGGVGTCGRGWGQEAGCGDMWEGVVTCGRGWGHVTVGGGM